MQSKMIKRLVYVLLAIIYLYASYELKVVRGYNQGYQSMGMEDWQVIAGGLIVVIFISKKLYDEIKYKMLTRHH